MQCFKLECHNSRYIVFERLGFLFLNSCLLILVYELVYCLYLSLNDNISGYCKIWSKGIVNCHVGREMTKVKYFKENSILHGLESKKILCIEIILDFFYDGFGSNKPGE